MYQRMRTQSLFPADRLIKLRIVEQIFREFFGDESCPSRSTIIGWIEEGTLYGQQIGSGRNYYVWESSLEDFKAKHLQNTMRAAA